MIIEFEKLELLFENLRNCYDEDSQIIAEVLKRELHRRKNAGRKATSKLTRREQNKIAQTRFRAKKKIAK